MRIVPKKRTYDFMSPFMTGAICNKSKPLMVYMLYEQSEVNPMDINVFVGKFGALKCEGGFNWGKDCHSAIMEKSFNKESNDKFWDSVITDEAYLKVKDYINNLQIKTT